jgi:flagellar biosynthesis protein FlhB
MARATESATESAIYDPTPQRIAAARRCGDVAQNPVLRGALAQAATVAALIALGPSIVAELRAYVAGALAQAPAGGDVVTAGTRALDVGARLIALPLAVAFAVTLLVGLVQTGGLWIGWPRPGFPGMRAGGAGAGPGSRLAAAARGGLAVAILLAVGAATLGPWLPALSRLGSPAGAAAPRALSAFGTLARQLGLRLAAAALLVGAGDEIWARLRHRQRMRLTRRELERERRELEGDPHRRRERRRRHAALGAGDPDLADVAVARRADLVVTGGALAVALGYQPEGGGAPVVVVTARGAGAARLIAEARAAGVPIFADAALARVLGDLAPGVEIPAATYQPVAEFLRITGLGRAIVERYDPMAVRAAAPRMTASLKER